MYDHVCSHRRKGCTIILFNWLKEIYLLFYFFLKSVGWMLGMENLRHDLAWLCRNLERRTISLICNQPFHIWDCGYVMRVTHHCTLTALLPKRSQGKLTKSWLFNHFNKVFSVFNNCVCSLDGVWEPGTATCVTQPWPPCKASRHPAHWQAVKIERGRKTTEQHKMASKSRMLGFHVDRFLFSSLWSLKFPYKANNYCVCTGISVVPPIGVPQ